MSLKPVFFLAAALLLAGGARHAAAQMSPDSPQLQNQNPKGMHIFMWGGLKTHGEGAHDYPAVFADWSKVLADHGAIVDGALHPPSAAELEHVDVMFIYRGDAGFITDSQKAVFEAFVKRGGGLVSIHDTLCGPDPEYLASLFGGGKKHGERNSQVDPKMHYQILDKDNPILKDWNDLTFSDEAFFLMTWAKNSAIHPLAAVTIAGNGPHKGEVVPQMWTYEHTLPGGKSARAYVWMQGHTYTNFALPQVENTLLRGIAWAGNRPMEELVTYVAPPRPARGGRGVPPAPPGKGQGNQ